MHKTPRIIQGILNALIILIVSNPPAIPAGSASDLRMLVANNLLLQRRWQEACYAFTAEITKNPSNADAYFQRSLCYYRLVQYDRAIADLLTFHKLAPNAENSFASSRLADCYYVKGDFQQAIAYYSRSINMDPSFPNNYRGRAACYIKLGQSSAAQKDQAVLNQLGGPVDADVAADFATKMLSIKAMAIKTDKGYVIRVPVSNEKKAIDLTAKYLRTIKEQSALIEADASNGEAYIERAEAFEMTDNHSQALADYNHVIDSEKKIKLADGCIESAYYGKASILLKLGRYQDALATYKTIMDRDANSEEGKYGEGYCLIKLGKYTEAVEALNDAEKLSNGKIAKVYEARAQAHTALGNKEAAQKDLKASEALKAKAK